jgi:type III secretion protein L
METTALLLSCTRTALSAFRESQALVLYVAPAQLADISAQLEPELAARVSVEGDASVAPGHARLSSPIASVELGLDTQLQIIRQTLVPQADETAA